MHAVFSVCLFLRPVRNTISSHYAGEDALANLSVERSEAGTITGHVRIRSKTQGIALSLGDRITMGMLIFSRDRYPSLLLSFSAKR